MRGEVVELISMQQALQRFPNHADRVSRLCNKVYDAGNPICGRSSTEPFLAHIIAGKNNLDGKHEFLPIIPPALQGKLVRRDIIEVISFEGFVYVTDILTRAREDEKTARCHWVTETLTGSHIECQGDHEDGWVRLHAFGLGIPVKPYVIFEK